MVKFIKADEKLKKELDRKNGIRAMEILKSLGFLVCVDSRDLNGINDFNKELAIKSNIRLGLEHFALVRSTNGLPRYGYVEPSYRYLPPAKVDSIFYHQLKQDGYTLNDYELEYLRARKTSHWTLNAQVNDHAWGTFSNRNFIIIEPLIEHINDKGLVNLNVNDTFFNDDLRLSDKAVILIAAEKYNEMIKNPNFLEELNNYDVRVFEGDEKVAVESVLYEMGYVYGEMYTDGFTRDKDEEDNLDRKNVALFEEQLTIACKAHAKEKGIRHGAHSKNQNWGNNGKTELEEEEENMAFSKRLFKDILSKLISKSQISKEIKAKLKTISVPLKSIERHDDVPKNSPKIAYNGLTRPNNRNVPSLNTKKNTDEIDYFNPNNYSIDKENNTDAFYHVFCIDGDYYCVEEEKAYKIIGPELILKAIKMSNEIIEEKVLEFRRAKDIELQNKGYDNRKTINK